MGIKHSFTHPYTPRTNGKAERFIQTILREWAYVRSYRNSAHRTQALQPWLSHYNLRRTHSALGHRPPISRIGMNNLLQLNRLVVPAGSSCSCPPQNLYGYPVLRAACLVVFFNDVIGRLLQRRYADM